MCSHYLELRAAVCVCNRLLIHVQHLLLYYYCFEIEATLKQPIQLFLLRSLNTCLLCLCFECRQCPEYSVAASRVVNYCAGHSNMYSSSSSIPLPQGGPQTSARRHGKRREHAVCSCESIASVSTCLPGSSL